jgi:ketosteroid isomerase-like protein
MSRLLLFAVLLPLAAPLGAQATHSSQTTGSEAGAVRRAIDAGNAAYIAAFKKADAKELSQVYDPRGSRLNEGGVVVRGGNAIAKDVGDFVAKVGPVVVTLDSKEFWVIDDQAYETGIWSYTFQPRGQAEKHIGGHYVTVWKKQPGGGWKIWADMGVPGT